MASRLCALCRQAPAHLILLWGGSTAPIGRTADELCDACAALFDNTPTTVEH